MLRVVYLKKNNKKITDVRLVDELTGRVTEGDFLMLLKHLGKDTCSNTDVIGYELVCTDGSIKSLPYYDEANKKSYNNCTAVIGKMGYNYIMADMLGKIHILHYIEAIKVIKDRGCYNAKVINRTGEPYISAIKGTFKEFYKDNNLLKECIGNEFRPNEDKGLLGMFKKKQSITVLGAIRFNDDTVLNIPGAMIGNFTKMTLPKGYSCLVIRDRSCGQMVLRINEFRRASITLKEVRSRVSKYELTNLDYENASNTIYNYNKDNRLKLITDVL